MGDHDDDREHDRAPATPAVTPTPPAAPAVTGELVPLRRPVRRLGNGGVVERWSGGRTPDRRPDREREPEPDLSSPLRRSDVDEWGRSEAMRSLARAVFGPVYRNWFR